MGEYSEGNPFRSQTKKLAPSIKGEGPHQKVTPREKKRPKKTNLILQRTTINYSKINRDPHT